MTASPGTPGQNAKVTFSGAQGQRISLRLTNDTIGSGFSCTATVTVQKPDGSALASNTCVQPAAPPFFDVQTLPVAGTYTIFVDPRDANTGSLTLTLYDVPADVSPTIAPDGSAVTMSMGTPGQNGRSTFAGTAGQRVSLKLSNDTIGSGFNCTAEVSIRNPDGSTLASDTCVQPPAPPFFDVRTLPSTGTYAIVVDPRDANTGSLTLTLYDVPADVTGTVAVGGPATTVGMTTPGQNARLTFVGTAGQQLTITLSAVTVGTSSCCSAKVSVANPDGTPLVSPTFFGTSGRTITFTPTATGDHTLVLDPQAEATGSATVSLAPSGGSFFAMGLRGPWFRAFVPLALPVPARSS